MAIATAILLGPVIPGAAAVRPSATAQRDRRVTLFYTAEVHGAVEPCGCTSDPLGDVSRLAALVADARRTGASVALVDAGGLLYPDGAVSAKERQAADLRAEFLAVEYERIGLLGAALGETDAIAGAPHVHPPRLASNLDAPAGFIRPPRVEKLGGMAIGVLGIADPAVASAVGSKARDPSEAAKRDVQTLRRAGAEVVVLLAAVDKSAARKLARDAGPDILVVGKRVGAGMARPERIGRTLLVASGEEMQRVGRLDIVLRTNPTGATEATTELQDAGGPAATRLRQEEIGRDLERLRVGLLQWTRKPQPQGGSSADDGTDRAFVAAKERERAELEAERVRLEIPWTPPATGNYVVNSLVPLRRSLRRDLQVVAAMKKLDQRIAAVNLKHATPPAPPEPGRPFYVGMDKCASCHASANAFWKRTVHAHAWKTLVEGGKQADYKCIGCHVTAFGEVGGASLGFTKKLESVQCETCHGPGSAHVAGEGNEQPLAVKRDVRESTCIGCHTEQHSDTFQFEPYLRDIVGPGHGQKRREKLGTGVTGHDLRSAALAKAKIAGGSSGAADPGGAVKKM
jgi:hypothetical protein